MSTIIEAIGALQISATAKYVGTVMLSTGVRKVAELAALVGLPKSTVYRAQGEFIGAGGEDILTSPTIPTVPTSENNLTVLTDEKREEKTVSLVSPVRISEPDDSRAHATKELPSEVVISKTITPIPPNPSLEALRAFEAYNDVALRCGLPQAAKLTPGREKRIKARLKTYGADGWAQALGNIEKSAFLRGQTKENFRADLDFVCQAKSFDRLHDGGYGNGAHVAPKATVTAIQIQKSDRQRDAELQEIGARFLS